MNLSDLIEKSSVEDLIRWNIRTGDINIESITDDSRKAGKGVLFVATEQGTPFLSDALERKPEAVLIDSAFYETHSHLFVSREKAIPPFILSHEVTRVQGMLASALHNHPSRQLFVAGITGTNGKTSTAWILYHLWKAMGISAGMIGTLGVSYCAGGREEHWKTGYTTPRSPGLQEIFARMLFAGVTHVVMEVSSEALALGRLEGTRFSVAAFLNLTPDHLDYHETMEEYFHSKMILIRSALEQGGEVVVGGDGSYEYRCVEIARQIDPERVKVVHADDSLHLSLIGRFNRLNASVALACSGLDKSQMESARKLSHTIPGVPGRLQMIPPPGFEPVVEGENPFDTGTGLPAKFGVVDYAHTPDALEKVLTELRTIGVRKLACVFGCGGNRDRLKRPMMGQISATLCDLTVITDDNPRKEDPSKIRREILDGMKALPIRDESLIEIGDRREAIFRGAQWLAEQKDVPAALVVAGKGHESEQIFSDHREVFVDGDELSGAFLRIFR